MQLYSKHISSITYKCISEVHTTVAPQHKITRPHRIRTTQITTTKSTSTKGNFAKDVSIRQNTI